MIRFVVVVALAALSTAAPAQAADRLYISTEADTAMFDGQAMWMIAARCAAVHDNVEARFVFERQQIEDYILRYPDSTWMREDFEADRPRYRELRKGERTRLARFGALRVAMDRRAPGPATFEAEAARQLAQMQAQPFTKIDEIAVIERACGTFMSQMVRGDVLGRMQAKWPDRPGRNG